MNTHTVKRDLEYYMGRLEPDYESKDHSQIASMLDQYGIPFYYKQPLLLWGNQRRTIVRPDFTLPTYNNAVIDYASKPKNNAGAAKLYAENNIVSIVLSDRDLAKPKWQDLLYDKLEDLYHQPK